jgi:hypothetical protein
MNRNKILIGLAVLVLVAVTLACSFTSNGNGSSPEPMAGLAGSWRDTAEGTTHTIAWNGSTYTITSSVNDDRGAYSIISEDWNGSTFTFVYRVPDGADVTIECVSVSGSNLNVNWSSTNGNSGTDTFTRK